MSETHALVSQAPQPTSEGAAMIAMIERAVRDPSVDVDKLREIIAIKREIAAHEAEHAFNAAMAAAQAEMHPIVTDRKNNQTRSTYASYAAIDRAIRPIYTKHGVSLSFNTEPDAPAGDIRMVCYASAFGHTRKYQADIPADGKGAKGGDVMTRTHAAGAAMSYGQRYLVKMIFNLAITDDDDGNKAGPRGVTSAFITPEQDDEIKLLLQKRPDPAAALQRFLAYYQIDSTADLPASRFEHARRALQPALAQKESANA